MIKKCPTQRDDELCGVQFRINHVPHFKPLLVHPNLSSKVMITWIQVLRISNTLSITWLWILQIPLLIHFHFFELDQEQNCWQFETGPPRWSYDKKMSNRERSSSVGYENMRKPFFKYLWSISNPNQFHN